MNRTVVSLTFDDGRTSQVAAGDLLASHSMHGTFYLNSGAVGDGSNALTWPEVQALADAGNEIGGHTVNHVDLTTLLLSDARAEICDDRDAFAAHGLSVSAFAYPAGDSNADIAALVAECGYTSARITQGIGTAGWCAAGNCPAAETIPPLDPYEIRAGGSVTDTVTLAQLKLLVTNAEQSGGGWVPFIFHDVGVNADGYSISTADFTEFLDWLSLRESRGTIVRTVGEVTSGTVDPPPPGPNLLQNPSFETDTDEDGLPDCWSTSSWGVNEGSWQVETGDAHAGSNAVTGTITAYDSGERTFLVDRSSTCAPAVMPGHTYRLTGWYKGTLSPHLLAFWDDGSGSFSLGSAYSRDFPESSTWHEFAWTTPPAPTGATALSIAVSVGGVTGNITIDDFALGDAAGTPPDLQITTPVADGNVSGSAVLLSATAGDSDGIRNLVFYIDDKPVGTVANAPYSLNWNSTTASEGTHTLTVLATDVNGAQSYDSTSFVVDNTAPAGSLTAPLTGAFLRQAVTLESNSSDTGSGIASASFQHSPAGEGNWTTIGTDTTSPYGASWETSVVPDGSYDLRVVTTDRAGNSHTSSSVSVTVDNTAPDVSLNTAPNDPTNSTAASFTFSSGDSTAGFLCKLDGEVYSTCSSPKTYTGVTEGSHSFSVKAIDPAGNVGGANSYDWLIDTTAPTISGVPADITAEATGPDGAVVGYSDPTATDIVDGARTVSCVPGSGSTFEIGDTTVTCSASDTAGNNASATFKVTVRDTTPPVISGVPADITAEATGPDGAVVGYSDPTATDIVDGARTVSCVPGSGSTFEIGDTTVTCSASDTAGNNASAAFKVTVRDTTAPTISGVPADITAEATGPDGAVVGYSDPTATDIVDGARTVSCVPASGSTFEIGDTTVTCSASDTAGNNASATFKVTVEDTIEPTGSLTAPTAGAFLRQTVTFESNSSDTGSGVASASFQRSPAGEGSWTTIGTDTTSPYSAGWDTTAVPDGSYDLRVVTTDRAGNSHASSSISVTVDNAAPDVSIGAHPANPSNSADAHFTFSSGDPTAGFLCSRDGADYTSCSSPKDYSGLAEGAHSFSVKSVDPAGNESGTADYSWTVDVTAPDVSIDAHPSSPTNSTSAGFSFSSTDLTAHFVCALDGESYSICSSPKEYSGLSEGSHTFSVKAVDPAGSESDAASFDWKINHAPVSNAGPDQTVNAGSTVLLDGSKSSDADVGDTLTYTWAQTSGPTVALSDVTAANPTFTAPASADSLTFKLTVSDGLLISSDSVAITAMDNVKPAVKIYKRPQTKLIKAKIRSAKHMATFRFSGSGGKGKLRFQCKLDKQKYKSCRSVKTYRQLKPGRHVFRVRARDARGKIDLTPARKRFKI